MTPCYVSRELLELLSAWRRGADGFALHDALLEIGCQHLAWSVWPHCDSGPQRRIRKYEYVNCLICQPPEIAEAYHVAVHWPFWSEGKWCGGWDVVDRLWDEFEGNRPMDEARARYLAEMDRLLRNLGRFMSAQEQKDIQGMRRAIERRDEVVKAIQEESDP